MDIITSKEGPYTVLQPCGRLGFAEEDDARQAFEAAVQETKAGIIVDCVQLEYLSSAGLRAFLNGAKAAEAKGVPFVACSLTADVASVFTISGFDHIIPVHPDTPAAAKSLKTAGKKS